VLKLFLMNTVDTLLIGISKLLHSIGPIFEDNVTSHLNYVVRLVIAMSVFYQ